MKVTGKECRFAVYVKPPEHGMPDMHFVKECTHYEDGTTKPTTNIIYDYQRPFWTVVKGARQYKQPKEWISKEILVEYKCPQHELIDRAARALGTPYFRGSLRDLQQNPYLFGTDIKSTAVLKHAYMQKYQGTKETMFSVAYLDIETDVINGTEEIIMLTVYYQGKCYTGVTKSFLQGIYSPIERIAQAVNQYLSEYYEKYQIENVDELYDSEIELLQGMIAKVHQMQPDFLAVWNLDYEMTKFIQAAQRADVDLKDIFSDPSVPKAYRYFNYKRGPSQKVTASGKISPVPPAARWHTVYTPASFYLIDAMCAFKHTRIGKQERPSYSLDAILGEELNLSKLKFTAADGYERLKWHAFMQQKYKIEYIVYNKFDCIAMHLLEEKNKDLSLFVPLYSGTSDFEDFRSQPRRLMDQLHWFVQEKGYVMGTTSQALVYDTHKEIPLTGWITNLDAELIIDSPLEIIKEDPKLKTRVFTNVSDLDISSSYPHGIQAFNISKETTRKEVLEIEGIPQEVYRQENMNLSSGHVDAVQWCTNIIGYPTLKGLLDEYDSNR